MWTPHYLHYLMTTYLDIISTLSSMIWFCNQGCWGANCYACCYSKLWGHSKIASIGNEIYKCIFLCDNFCEARRASHCHSPQTTFSSNSTCCVLSTQKSAMHVVVYADRLTTQHSIVDIVHWSWSYWQFCYPRGHVECFWAALAAHWISSASHTSVLP